jgi:hypothetical protein
MVLSYVELKDRAAGKLRREPHAATRATTCCVARVSLAKSGWCNVSGFIAGCDKVRRGDFGCLSHEFTAVSTQLHSTHWC